MKLCPVCGGATADPGEITGYAGKWCQCVFGQSPRYGMLPPFEDKYPKPSPKSPFEDLIKQLPGPVVVGPQPAPTPISQPAAMTAEQFVIWMRGYCAAHSGAETMTKGDWKVIMAKLDTLGGPK